MSSSKKTLIIGASENPERYSNKAFYSLIKHGYEVEMIGHNVGQIEQYMIRNDKPNFDNIDTVTMYVNPKNQEQYYSYILSLKPKRIIFNPGTENPELEKLALQNGIATTHACTLVLLSTGQY